jgi:hypothetical protein
MDKLANIDAVLDKYVPAEELNEVKRILYGYNRGALVPAVPLTAEGQKYAQEHKFDLKVFRASVILQFNIQLAVISHRLSDHCLR